MSTSGYWPSFSLACGNLNSRIPAFYFDSYCCEVLESKAASLVWSYKYYDWVGHFSERITLRSVFGPTLNYEQWVGFGSPPSGTSSLLSKIGAGSPIEGP